MDTGSSSAINMLSSLLDVLGLRILAWERPPQLIEREELPEGLAALWADLLLQLAFQVWMHLS